MLFILIALIAGGISYMTTGNFQHFLIGAAPAAMLGLYFIVILIIWEITERRKESRK